MARLMDVWKGVRVRALFGHIHKSNPYKDSYSHT